MKPFRWGILGPGKIAHKFAQSLPYSKNGKLVCVASTDLERAKQFAETYHADHAFGSYFELIDSGLIDAIYISTTNQLHFENAVLAIEHGIAVLCEKPLCMTVSETEFLIQLAKNKKVFLMEGLWSLFLPHIQQAMDWVKAGKIGELVHIQADFGFKANYDPESRIFNPLLGGSVTKDIGIYPLALFQKMLGKFQTLQQTGFRAPTGADDHILFQGTSESGSSFQGMVSFRTSTHVEASFFGRNGKIRLSSQWLRPGTAILESEDGTQIFSKPADSFGFQYEADEVERCVRAGFLESAIWPLNDSFMVSKYMEQITGI